MTGENKNNVSISIILHLKMWLHKVILQSNYLATNLILILGLLFHIEWILRKHIKILPQCYIFCLSYRSKFFWKSAVGIEALEKLFTFTKFLLSLWCRFLCDNQLLIHKSSWHFPSKISQQTLEKGLVSTKFKNSFLYTMCPIYFP